MNRLQSIINGAREFVAGVRAIPELVDTGRVPWNPGDPISTITRLVCSRDCAQEREWEAKQEAKALRSELDQERAAHEETKRKLAENQSHLGAGIDTLNKFSGDYYRDFAELQKTKADLEIERAARQKAETELAVSSEMLKETEHFRQANQDHCNRLGPELSYTKEQLTSALETIDALTPVLESAKELRERWNGMESHNQATSSLFGEAIRLCSAVVSAIEKTGPK